MTAPVLLWFRDDLRLADQPAVAAAVASGAPVVPVYVFDDDPSGKSSCNAGCIGAWSPVTASGGSTPMGNSTIFERDDHRRQWAYKGRPLYTYFNDTPASRRATAKKASGICSRPNFIPCGSIRSFHKSRRCPP